MDKYEAIKMAGRLLYVGGYVNEEYIEAMIERENEFEYLYWKRDRHPSWGRESQG